jgi:site-specific recombinase XerD
VTNSDFPVDELFERFKREKQFLEGVSVKTIQTYNDAWKAFDTYGKKDVSESGIKDFAIEMISSGMKPGAVNSFAASINSFLTWLFENDHTENRLKVPLQKVGKRVLQTYRPEEVEKILSYKPKRAAEKRLMTILCLLIDSGCRINEALTLTRKNVDLDNLLVTFKGKGNKERRVPISMECRKVLFRWLQTHKNEYVFAARNGNKLRYDNLDDPRAILEQPIRTLLKLSTHRDSSTVFLHRYHLNHAPNYQSKWNEDAPKEQQA